MEAVRETVDVVGRSVTILLPDTFAARRVQVIVLPAPEQDTAPPAQRLKRQPSPLLAGTRIIGDIMGPVVDDDDWHALK